MDMNDYLIDTLVRQRLDDLRADARRAVLAAALGAPRQRLWIRLGASVMRLSGRVLLDSTRRRQLRRDLLLREMQRRSPC
jgi:hypothetical protein